MTDPTPVDPAPVDDAPVDPAPVPDPEPPAEVETPADPLPPLVDKLSNTAIANIRTIVPGIWATLVGITFSWLVLHGVISNDIAVKYQGLVISVSTGVVLIVFITLVKLFASWIEKRTSPLSRAIAKILLIVVAIPHYTAPVPVEPKQPTQ